MSLIKPMGRPFIACPKCGTNVVWPEELSSEDKTMLARTSRHNRLEGARVAHMTFDLDLGEAKVLSFHISSGDGRCHRCGLPVADELSVCSTCRSANLNW